MSAASEEILVTCTWCEVEAPLDQMVLREYPNRERVGEFQCRDGKACDERWFAANPDDEA